MDTLVYVKGAEKMVTAARLLPEGVYVRFADGRDGVIPLTVLAMSDSPRSVTVPHPHIIRLLLKGGQAEEIPWDFARHYVDERYRKASTDADARGRRLFAERLRALRSELGMTQKELAGRSGITRVSVARIETAQQSPRYRTLTALAEALNVPIERLLAGP
jgi:DNA-binding XRE family transcriptional regulator